MKKGIYLLFGVLILLTIVIVLCNNKKELNNIKILSFYKLNGDEDNLFLVEYEKEEEAKEYKVEIIDNNNKIVFSGSTTEDLLTFRSDKIEDSSKYKVKVCSNFNCDVKMFNKIDNFINNDYVCSNILDANTYNEEMGNKIVAMAKEYLGIPFHFNNLIKDPNAKIPKEKFAGIDCCGFANAVYESVFNRSVGKKPADMALETKDKCVRVQDVRPGDMVFWIDFNNEREFLKFGRIFHIGIYVGNDRVIEATRNPDYGYTGVTYSDLYRLRGNTFLAMITRPYA